MAKHETPIPQAKPDCIGHSIDYHLPEELIAQEPLADRSASRLLVLHKNTGRIEHRTFRDIGDYLQKGDLMVMNNTVVTARTLIGRRIRSDSTKSVPQEFLLMGVTPEKLKSQNPEFEFMCRSAKRLKFGSIVAFETGSQVDGKLLGQVCGTSERGFKCMTLQTELGSLDDLLESASTAALPPYIHQSLSARDRYQTVYAGSILGQGSAAAPTAGLHFTPQILEQLAGKGIDLAYVNLSVGLDTFRPIQSATLEEHKMVGEECELSVVVAEKISRCNGKIIAVGTTSCRTLETFARQENSTKAHLATGTLVSQLFLYPGKPLMIVDGLLTNFHMPSTTMLLMIAAMAGRENIERAYAEAVQLKYRFLSFGDAMLII